jgi:hypothetical protein
MLKVIFAIIGFGLMVALITLTNPCLAQQQSIAEGNYNSPTKRYNFLGEGKANVGEYELGKDFIAGKDPADPPPER